MLFYVWKIGTELPLLSGYVIKRFHGVIIYHSSLTKAIDNYSFIVNNSFRLRAAVIGFGIMMYKLFCSESRWPTMVYW